jgi:UDP-N-acetylglucosamine 2-epimerase (non-hydrolysing)
MKIVTVAGARPNFMKIAPIGRAIQKWNATRYDTGMLENVLVHTGQHYDENMSQAFFEDLGLAPPDAYLGVGSGPHGEQTGRIMIEFERVCMEYKPDLVLVVGDVNSTIAAALVASKLHIPVAHVEAGLRSFDRTMPEEINRLLTDAISTYLFTTCQEANQNLVREGVAEERIFLVGDVMIDTLLYHREGARRHNVVKELHLQGLDDSSGYCLLTLHRPSNVDTRQALAAIMEAVYEVARDIPVIFPVHPRTGHKLREFDLMKGEGVHFIKPLSYLKFLSLMLRAEFVITDSGGIQEETTVLGIPCLTLRDTTERPVTLEKGTNTLVSPDKVAILREAGRILAGCGKKSTCIELWDGKAAERIVAILAGSTHASTIKKQGW